MVDHLLIFVHTCWRMGVICHAVRCLMCLGIDSIVLLLAAM